MVEIPDGYQLSLIDISLTEASALAQAEIENRPAQGATGRFTLVVNWSHPVPLGVLAFELRVYASSDGSAPPITVSLTEPGVNARMRSLFEQDSAVDLALTGPLVQTFYDQILARGGEISPDAGSDLDGGATAGTAGTIAVTIAIILAICVAIGFVTFAAVLVFAMAKGYNIDNAGYKVAVGEGASRQEHQMVFNIRKPPP